VAKVKIVKWRRLAHRARREKSASKRNNGEGEKRNGENIEIMKRKATTSAGVAAARNGARCVNNQMKISVAAIISGRRHQWRIENESERWRKAAWHHL
jgi:hypothetical protein